ncbi:hypothetical protein CONLIGDRAFT_596672 [Coniochaeta ligniaria NRRL 30616]|uniref:dolichol kinase n=1 Tax=Coniochaeta ligniaria NRRL 30616 TaxID=1408157 RepID=A0A1J7JJ14_9PEZI|nr:hypothetical protein CONLIGDRAFT_596672 [Coniochaeta ligniaria NRRL 30616]
MHDKSELPNPAPIITATTDDEDGEHLRILSRSPHPYHRQKSDLLEPSDIIVYNAAVAVTRKSTDATALFTKESTPASDSGTEADDEHFLKRLPAPKARLHKGLRGQNEPLSGTSTPLLSPAICEEEARPAPTAPTRGRLDSNKRSKAEKIRRRKELVRRFSEVLLLVCLGGLVHANQDVQPFVTIYRRELAVGFLLFALLLAIYPIRLVFWAYRHGQPSRIIPISIPPSFDPAPILYPQILPTLLSLLVAANVQGAVPTNVILSLSTLPALLIPTIGSYETLNPVHWLLTCVPLFLASDNSAHPGATPLPTETPGKDLLVLIYPLHQHLCSILQYLTTTSLLTAELQLLSVGLINTLLLSYSPQAQILKALLWVAGLGIIILCGPVIRWGIILARVPKWRFSRSVAPARGFSVSRLLRSILLVFTRPRHDFPVPDFEHTTAESGNSSDDDYDMNLSRAMSIERARRRVSLNSAGEGADGHVPPPDGVFPSSTRRHTLPAHVKPGPQSKTHTPSGRRKRSASSTVQSFFSLTRAQATTRKWLYAGYVYVCILAIILGGVREYIRVYALAGNEPIGWALGYLFGDLPWFRFQVVKANLQRWVLLPPRSDDGTEVCFLGRVEHIRHAFLGEANTRLFLSGYFLAIIVTGLAVVFRLSPIYEVDTRRKVFHFMMVAMFLPATFVDPTFAALGLSIVLAVFLLLDLLRASQLPPLSKPIANFLTPYVDGRDLRGPVVVSHIFLLIGCAIPLWLSLAALPRAGRGALAGWEVPTRDVSMVSGVVCVGLGDAAASLIGRRWGRRKWLWGGGKSLEGSLAFGLAVFVGLMAASVWLKIGGWPVSGGREASAAVLQGWGATVQKTALCASMASLTEAVLTGGNDNVVVPVVLWACVKSTGI